MSKLKILKATPERQQSIHSKTSDRTVYQHTEYPSSTKNINLSVIGKEAKSPDLIESKN